jgi:hypothetical protein
MRKVNKQSARSIGKLFGVSEDAIRRIWTNKTWITKQS